MASPDAHGRLVLGFLGLGSLGHGIARRLLARGWKVIGYDPAAAARSRHAAAGGDVAGSVSEVAEKADVLFVALSSMAAYWRVVSEIAAVSRPSGWVLDVNTLSPDDKRAARERLSAAGWTMLDCTFSGNADMVEHDLHTFYFSGDGRDAPAITPVLADLGEKRFDMGEFGNAALIKLIINHLVFCHNVVSAEAMSLALKAGIDAETVFSTVTASAGNSKVFEVRGRMMVEQSYPHETIYRLVVDKDARVIADMARELRHPIPMFSLAVQTHTAALNTRWAETDPGSLCAIMEEQSGIERKA